MNEPQIVEYKNIRVLTTQQLADSYKSNSDAITKNFNRNKDRYVEGFPFASRGTEYGYLAKGQFVWLPENPVIHRLLDKYNALLPHIYLCFD